MGWGDGDDSWDDAEDDNAFANSNIGGGDQLIKPFTTVNNASSMGGFSDRMNDDPFASLRMKTATSVKPRSGGPKVKLALPKRAPPAKKLAIDATKGRDGWDDF